MSDGINGWEESFKCSFSRLNYMQCEKRLTTKSLWQLITIPCFGKTLVGCWKRETFLTLAAPLCPERTLDFPFSGIVLRIWFPYCPCSLSMWGIYSGPSSFEMFKFDCCETKTRKTTRVPVKKFNSCHFDAPHLLKQTWLHPPPKKKIHAEWHWAVSRRHINPDYRTPCIQQTFQGEGNNCLYFVTQTI